ncbi:hypothetical protein QZH41_000163 [Actinostola sp. cb2023]|nr:hypothetical protein QZH41_000163 [Actinostola sp. cb2023]
MLVIRNSLDLATFDHCMFWAACNIGYFGFLRASEFTVPNLASFSSAQHLQVSDISVDSATQPTCLRIRIKASKTDPFRQGCFVHIGRGSTTLCAVEATLDYLVRRGNSPGPLFIRQSGLPLSRSLLTSWLRSIIEGVQREGIYCGMATQGMQREGIYCGMATQGVQREGIYCGMATQGVQREGIYCGMATQGMQREGIYCGTATQGVQREGIYCGTAT